MSVEHGLRTRARGSLQCSRGPLKSFGGDNNVEDGTGLAITRRIVAAENHPVAAILALDPFERFVFVISVLEGRPEKDCAILRRSLRATLRLPACWRSSVW
jgi:hypothetical protein